MLNNCKVGQAVLFPNVYGDTYSKKYSYRYGQVMAGFITDIEYIEARDSYLYTIGIISPEFPTNVYYKTVGMHRIFDINDREGCLEEVKKLAEEVVE